MNPKLFKSFFSKFITERVGEIGLTESQIVFLTILDEEKGMSLKGITERIGVHKSLTTRAIRHLSENGYVLNSSESGKEHSILLTPKGAEAKELAIQAFNELFEFILEDITDDELEVMERVMSKIKHKIEGSSVKTQ